MDMYPRKGTGRPILLCIAWALAWAIVELLR